MKLRSLLPVFGLAVTLGVAAMVTSGRTTASGTAVPLAQDSGQEIITRMTAPQIERIIKSFDDVTEFEEVGADTYTFRVNGTKLFFLNKETTMQIGAAFDMDGISLSTINAWNRDKRFAKAYLDKVNDPILEADIELNGGVTEDNIKEWMKTFVLLLKQFLPFIRGE